MDICETQNKENAVEVICNFIYFLEKKNRKKKKQKEKKNFVHYPEHFWYSKETKASKKQIHKHSHNVSDSKYFFEIL